jgi:hypothetical protein
MSRRSRKFQRLLLPTLAPLLFACISVGPPIRASHYGAPGRMEAGMVEASGNVTWADAEIAGGPMVGYGVSEAVAVEGGGEVGSNQRAIGYAGVRYTPLRPNGRSRAFVLDLESGAGAGVGGTRCVNSVCDSPRMDWSRPAGGGYLGIGIGGKINWFSPWLRLRTQASVAKDVPITSITSAGAGVQFSIASLAHIYMGTGVYLLTNQNVTHWGFAYFDGGLSFTIATPRTRRLREQRAGQDD